MPSSSRTWSSSSSDRAPTSSSNGDRVGDDERRIPADRWSGSLLDPTGRGVASGVLDCHDAHDVECGRLVVLRPAPHDPVPTEVPALVVRLEPRAAALLQSSPGLHPPHGRPLSGNRRATGCPPRLRLPGCGPGPEPVAPPGEVVPGDPALHR